MFWVATRKKAFLGNGTGVLLLFILFNSPLQLGGIAKDQNGSGFSFMSYNAHNFGAFLDDRDLPSEKKIVGFVKQKQPDIICFQEFSKFQFQEFNHYPYQFIGYRPDYEKTLQVIYSTYPIVNRGYVDFEHTRNQTIYADIKFDDEVVRVYNIHLQSYKLILNTSILSVGGILQAFDKIDDALKQQAKQVEIVLKHAETFKGKIIFAGDFNSTAYSKNYRKLKGDKIDTYVEKGLGLGKTYDVYGYPFRVDFVLVNPDIKVISHKNFNTGFSDHEAILSELDL